MLPYCSHYRFTLPGRFQFDGMVNMKAKAVSSVSKKVFVRVGRMDLKAHCHRSAFLRWGGRSGAPTQELLQTTHHSPSSTSWLGYFGDGQAAYAELDPDALEKLQAIFPYPATGMPFDLPQAARHDWLPWVLRCGSSSSSSSSSSSPLASPARAAAASPPLALVLLT